MGRKQHRLHGDPRRFEVVAEFVADRYGTSVRTVADVAGGQGLLTRILHKRYGYTAEVVDPRGFTLRGVPGRVEELDPSQAGYYDLIVGLHPDEAMRAVAEAALSRPTILIPCCNFWSDERLSQDALLGSVESYLCQHGVGVERVRFGFRGPKNVGLVSSPAD